MKMSFFLIGLILVGCASSSHQIVAQRAIVDDTTAVAIPRNASIFSDIPLKPMTASQSAARMN